MLLAALSVSAVRDDMPRRAQWGGCRLCVVFFFFNDTATTEIYPLSLHAPLPISLGPVRPLVAGALDRAPAGSRWRAIEGADRESTRLKSSHGSISHVVLCFS